MKGLGITFISFERKLTMGKVETTESRRTNVAKRNARLAEITASIVNPWIIFTQLLEGRLRSCICSIGLARSVFFRIYIAIDCTDDQVLSFMPAVRLLTVADGLKVWDRWSPDVITDINMINIGTSPFLLAKCVEFVTKFCWKLTSDTSRHNQRTNLLWSSSLNSRYWREGRDNR